MTLTEIEQLLDSSFAVAKQALGAAVTAADLEAARVQFLGQKGFIQTAKKAVGQLAAVGDKKKAGKLCNDKDKELADVYAHNLARIEAAARGAALAERLDVTLPGRRARRGHRHPLTTTCDDILTVLSGLGFSPAEGPEVEHDFYNFEALNFPSDHPARDMQDTFWLTNGNLLRTHTSAGQVRAMRQFKPPFKAIFPGRVFRYESTDASHDHTFHQVEGLFVSRHVSVAHLIASMKTLLSEVFGREVTVRLRPGYFPFVEPGFELDISCLVCGGPGCSVCKRSGWVELLPCGLIHPNVLRAGGLDPAEWQGWAFGLGLSRLVMMRYQIEDIRHLLGGDVRFWAQFNGSGLE